MGEIKCKNCGAVLKQTKGKRAKEFCNVTCRSGYWQKKKRLGNAKTEDPHPATQLYTKALGLPSSDDEKKVTLKKHKKGSFKLKGIIPPKEIAMAQSIQYDPNVSFDAEALKNFTHDEPAMYQEAEVVSSELKLPTDPMELKRMAEAGVPDLVAFKKHVASIKMTAGQRAMIYSKLK